MDEILYYERNTISVAFRSVAFLELIYGFYVTTLWLLVQMYFRIPLQKSLLSFQQLRIRSQSRI